MNDDLVEQFNYIIRCVVFGITSFAVAFISYVVIKFILTILMSILCVAIASYATWYYCDNDADLSRFNEIRDITIKFIKKWLKSK